jgi:delta 1-pyrroline-5-carboxylate dehydrogenase
MIEVDQSAPPLSIAIVRERCLAEIVRAQRTAKLDIARIFADPAVTLSQAITYARERVHLCRAFPAEMRRLLDEAEKTAACTVLCVRSRAIGRGRYDAMTHP